MQMDQLVGMPGKSCRGAEVCRGPRPPDQAGLHADSCLQHEGLFVRAVLQYPGKPGAGALGRTPAGLLEEEPQIAFPPGKVMELHEHRKLPGKATRVRRVVWAQRLALG